MNRKLKSKIVLKFGTQEDFAKAIDEKPSVISNIVRGRRILSSEKQLRWALMLDCPVNEIFPKLEDEFSKNQ
jgi:transcriptional regulator with XRE-family HTH domain